MLAIRPLEGQFFLKRKEYLLYGTKFDDTKKKTKRDFSLEVHHNIEDD